MHELSISVGCENTPASNLISNEDSIKYIAMARFKKVFMSFVYDHLFDNPTYRHYMDLIKENGLGVSFVHLGYRVNDGIKTLWEEGESGDKLIEDYMKDIDVVAGDGIRLVCMHLTKSRINSPLTQVGIDRLKRLVSYARTKGVVVALENTVWKDHLVYAADNIQDDYLTFCYDSGHDHCHFKDSYPFDIVKGKISCVHLHDNDGSADQHMLPFDGTIDWDGLVANLKNSNFEGDVTGEIFYKEDYKDLTPLKFYQETYRRLDKIREMLYK